MKKAFVIMLMSVLFFTACSKKNNVKSSADEVIIDNNVDTLTLVENLDSYLEYNGEISDDNTKLNITFTFKKGVTVPENPPTVQAKVLNKG